MINKKGKIFSEFEKKSIFPKKCINYKDETSSDAVEKPSRYDLNQMIRISITRNQA